MKDSILLLCLVLEEDLFTAISCYKLIEREEPRDGMEL